MNITVYIASAFTKNHQGGNKAGVVFMDTSLTREQKMTIAKELGFAETAFITKSDQADYRQTDYRLEYFTPKGEVDLCGHATIATFTVLQHLNRLNKPTYRIETNSGILDITIDGTDIFMQQNTPTFYDEIDSQELVGSFDLDLLNPDYPIQIVSTGLRDIIVPIKSTTALSHVVADFEQVKTVSAEYNVIGMHLFTIGDKHIVCRNFAPLYDIDEEAATGTSNAALASYLYHHNILRQDQYVFEQGYALGAGSEIKVKLTTDEKHAITRVQVGGRGDFSEARSLIID